jgi:hypothetical protein
MTDPFKDRPEDFLNRGLKAAVGSIPVIGGTAAEFFSFVVGDPAQERRDDFLRSTFNRIENLEGEFEKLKPEALRESEQFQATVVQAVRIASTTASEEKKKLLQNAILNSAIGTVDEFYRQVFMQLLEQITPPHVVLLAYLDNPKGYPAAVDRAKSMYAGARSTLLEAALPELTSNKDMFSRVSSDLHRLGLADTSSNNVMMTGGDSMLSPQTTDIGRSFLAFISSPEEKKEK